MNGFGDGLSVQVIFDKSLAMVLECVQGAGGDDANLPHSAAEQFAMSAGFSNHLSGARQGGSDRCAESFTEADADRVEVVSPTMS